ncbi:tRNA (adenosine(37)-N6)-dimethylallyltransferase MiaA [Lachnoclostridium edouardi]|uniref:tRNA (adenosine(37)-N6)-dimethylallyltransferase MiaA n=1 Tax=Lachnoclostridium edouardi TaxID=1926283 RepID=UPI000C7CB68D|nr:tRNA (adenosine(37)-N6)-dimethylallyltransferase MiaA [Lachnoclostridium edouardi]
MELSKNNNINRNKKLPLIVLTGPTAVGKTDLSVDLAKAVNGEIISADSMQVYRHMDIGSAKIKEEEMRGVPHHLINVLEPTEDFNVVIFKQLAQKALEDIYSRNKVPIIAGGTGFYIQALLNDIDFKENEEGGRIRKKLEEDVAKYGASWLHNQLCQVDPKSGEAIHENNVKRVIRALEYYQLTGQKISLHNEQEKQKNSPYAFLYYVLNTERSLLYERIDKRVDLMMKEGLVEEVKALKELGCRRGITSMQGLGYKEILDYLDGLYSLDEAVYILKRDTRHFAKRQLTWFRREKDVRWLYLPEFDNNKENILNFILKEWNQMTGETNACLEEEK